VGKERGRRGKEREVLERREKGLRARIAGEISWRKPPIEQRRGRNKGRD